MIPALAVVRAHWKAVAGGVALLAFVALALLWRAEKRHSDKLQTQLTASEEGRRQDRASYQNAQVAAAAMNKAQVAIIEAKQEEVSAEVSKDYAGDLARLRSELGRMRSQGRAAQSVAGRSEAGGVSKPAQRVDGSDELPIPPQDILSAAEIELQLMHLQDWVEDQARVAR